MKVVVLKGGLSLGSLASLVTLAFVIAKLAGAIDWSWWIVFSPVLAYIALSILVVICILLVVGIGILIGYTKLKNFLKRQESVEGE